MATHSTQSVISNDVINGYHSNGSSNHNSTDEVIGSCDPKSPLIVCVMIGC